MTKAPITPGTQPHKVRSTIISIEPQPLSITARGGKRMQRRTRQKDIESTKIKIPHFVFSKMGNKI